MLSVRLPLEELLATVTVPVEFPAWVGLKTSVSVAVCPGFKVSGVVMPELENSEPATEMPETVTGPLPVEDKVTVCVEVCPVFTLPNATEVVLAAKVAVGGFS